MSRFLPLAFIPAAPVVALAGCLSWHSEALSPAQLIATRKPPVVRITRTDSSKVVLRDPEVAGDTLFGRPQSPSNDSLGERTGIPLAGIHSIATYQSDATRSIADDLGAGRTKPFLRPPAGPGNSPVCSRARGLYCGHGNTYGRPSREHSNEEGWLWMDQNHFASAESEHS